jgi:ankyrin repeat protein
MEKVTMKVRTHPAIGLAFSIAIVNPCFAASYYIPAQCPTGTKRVELQSVEVPKEFLPLHDSDQGTTPTCGFHAPMVAVNAIHRLAHPESQYDLSTLDAVLTHGECDAGNENNLFKAKNVVPTLLNIRESGQIALDRSREGTTLKEAWNANHCLVHFKDRCVPGKCDRLDHSSCFEEFCANTPDLEKFYTHSENFSEIYRKLDSEVPIGTLSEKLREEKVKVSFDIVPQDVFADVSDLKKAVLQAFSQSDPKLPLVLSTCYRDQPQSKNCEGQLHAVALKKIAEVACKDLESGQVKAKFFEAAFVNSWGGAGEGPFYLDAILKGMQKYRRGFTELKPCGANLKNPCSMSPLLPHPRAQLFCHYAEAGKVQYLSELNGDPNENCFQFQSEFGTPLHQALATGRLNTVEALLNHPQIDVNSGALQLSVHSNWPRIVERIVSHPNFKFEKSLQEALFIAIEEAHHESLAALLAHPDADPNDFDGDDTTLLQYAVARQDDKSVKILLGHPRIKVNQLNPDGTTPLIDAIQYGNDTAAHKILKHPKIDVNIRGSKGSTPLGLVVEVGNLDLSRAIIRAGADLNQPNSKGFGPLHLAIIRGHRELVELLLESGANPNDKAGDDSPLDLVSRLPSRALRNEITRLIQGKLSGHEEAARGRKRKGLMDSSDKRVPEKEKRDLKTKKSKIR